VALESLSVNEEELRKATAGNEAQQLQLTNIIEDQQGDIQQLKDSEAEVKSEVERLVKEIERLQAQNAKAHGATPHSTPLAVTSGAQNQQLVQSNEDLRKDMQQLRITNQSLATEATQARADQASMASTLQGV